MHGIKYVFLGLVAVLLKCSGGSIFFLLIGYGFERLIDGVMV